ncbi:MAG: DUF1501 domain-containing protein [Phycisphaerales bacterium]
MDCCSNRIYAQSRRDVLRLLGCGFGYLALMGLMGRAAEAGEDGSLNPLSPKATHFRPSAKRVIFLCMSGGPSHVDTFDYKPELFANDGSAIRGGGVRAGAKLLAPPWKFRQHGKSGLWLSDLFPSVAQHADEMCLLRGMKTDVPAHAQAFLKLHTGSFQFVRPSLGAWTLYGLGTDNENLPGFITLNPPANNGGPQNYGAGFLPAMYQGTRLGADRGNGAAGRPRGQQPSEGMPDIANRELTVKAQREQLDLVQRLNRERLKKEKGEPDVEGIIQSYELAFRMQAEVPELMDLSRENKATLDLYGIGDGETDGFGRQCLLARRFAEKGVRFIEVGLGGWDTHRNLRADMERNCRRIDKPIAGLLTDLKRRGLLKDTLVVWGGEFGRTPYAQNGDGRDHNNKGFTLWMAGGGVRGGMSHGSTDETGAEAVQGVMDMHDLHATILHLMGLDHEKLTFNYAGRDFRLTEVYGHVAKEIVA